MKVAVPTMEVIWAVECGEMTILPEVDPPEYAVPHPAGESQTDGVGRPGPGGDAHLEWSCGH